MPSPEACAAAITCLPGIGPGRVLAMIRGRDPRAVWLDVLAGRVTRSGPADPSMPRQPDLLGGEARRADRSWAEAATALDPERRWEAALSRGVHVTWIDRDDYPQALRDDPHPPGIVFWRGSLESLSRPRVAIVGTRSASLDGRAAAHQMSMDLVAAGVCVISGLALGIDGSAHRGALDALKGIGTPANAGAGAGSTVGVAASGVDVPYPKRHASLWEEVVAAGAVISETPPGYPAQAWRFPARNRVIAGLAQLVVVVESHAAGGSLITADAAIERGVEVRAVPGPVSSPSCAGSNQLLYDGAGLVRSARDVLDALGMLLPEQPEAAPRGSSTRRSAPARDRRLGPTERAVLTAVGWTPATTNKVAERCALPVGQVAAALESLTARGILRDDRGWWQRVRR